MIDMYYEFSKSCIGARIKDEFVTEDNPYFEFFYEECRGKKKFDLANLSPIFPDYGTIVISGGKIVGGSFASQVTTEDNVSWYIPAWCYLPKHSKYSIPTSLQVIDRIPKNSILISHVMTRHPNPDKAKNYRGALIMSKRMGFKTVASDEITDIVQLVK